MITFDTDVSVLLIQYAKKHDAKDTRDTFACFKHFNACFTRHVHFNITTAHVTLLTTCLFSVKHRPEGGQ